MTLDDARIAYEAAPEVKQTARPWESLTDRDRARFARGYDSTPMPAWPTREDHLRTRDYYLALATRTGDPLIRRCLIDVARVQNIRAIKSRI